MGQPSEPVFAPELVETLGSAVAETVAVPLMLVSQGQHEAAWRIWLEIRDDIDRAVGARLAHSPSPQGASLLDALGVSLATGVGDAAELVDHALSLTSDPVERADAKRAAAKLGTWCGDILRTATLTIQAAEEVTDVDPERAGALWLDAATALAHSGHLRAGRDAARQVGAAVAPSSGLDTAADLIERWCTALLGETVELPESDEALIGALGDDDVRTGVMLAGALVWIGRHDQARSLLGRIEATARATAPDTLPFVLAVVADLDLRSGWWRSASEAVIEAETRSRHSGARNIRALVLVRGARIDALRGRRDAALDRLGEAERIAQQAALLFVTLHAASTRALLAAGDGDYEQAVAEGRHARAYAREIGLGLPGVDLYSADLVEALVRTGALRDAAALVDELSDVAARLDHAPTAAIAARGRLLVCDDDEIEAVAAEALACHELVPLPFEQARTNLILGERRRRSGARREARVALAEAHGAFTRLEAVPWAARALAELRAAGARQTTGTGGDDLLVTLTPQERQVARFVADGATNQEAAAAMFLSTKSIERHLTSAYRKLGIRSRTELGRLFDRHEAERKL